MNLLATLNHTVSAINAHSRAVATAGKNLANVNNPAYARERVVYGNRGTVITGDGPETLGLDANGVEQMRDALLDRQVAREVGLTGAADAEQSAFQRAQAALGESVDQTGAASGTSTSGTGIGAAIDSFFNAFQSFAADPGDDAQRENVLQNAAMLTDRLHQADARLAQVQTDLGQQACDDADNVNGTLKTIADLNAQIAQVEVNAPGSAVDLRDARQAKLEELAAKLPVTVIGEPDGTVRLEAAGANGTPVPLVAGGTVQGTVAFDGTQLAAGTPAAALAPASGSIQGALAARSGAIQTLRGNLDALARQLVTSVNAAYNPPGTTGAFFDPAGTTAATIQVVSSVTPGTLKASNGGAAGDNTVALAVAELSGHAFSQANGDAIDGTFSGHFSETVASIGQSLADANARVDDQKNIETLVRNQRDAVSGVSLDEEMSDLMKFQRAFQASSRVFNVVDDLLDTVINRMGV